MKIKRKALLPAAGLVILAGLGLQGHSATTGGKINSSSKSDTTRSIAPYFTPATNEKKTPDAEGFIQRWLLSWNLVTSQPRTNTVILPIVT